jgi:RimJ/RimL family protein N-acetyltransferase/8-oxo-dGTP pyrophosphatase MutT (NUDIX family)
MDEITLRCRIRPFEREDACDVYAFSSLPEVALNANFLPHRSPAMTQDNLNRWKTADDIFAIQLLEEKKVIGAISFRGDAASPAGWFKIGYTCNPHYQGHGYIGEALRKVMDHLFYDLDAPGIALHIFADNLASINVAHRAGFARHSESNRKTRFDGVEVIENVYRLTNREYREMFMGRWFGEIRSTSGKGGETKEILRRRAVRAIIRKDDKFLLVQSADNDVKFPGGGIETGETPIEALKREVLEETGYTVTMIKSHVGYIEELSDAFESDTHLFAMRSDYYEATVSTAQDSLKLDDYEARLGFHPVWMTLDQAIDANEKCTEPKRWTKRDSKILGFLKSDRNV